MPWHRREKKCSGSRGEGAPRLSGGAGVHFLGKVTLAGSRRPFQPQQRPRLKRLWCLGGGIKHVEHCNNIPWATGFRVILGTDLLPWKCAHTKALHFVNVSGFQDLWKDPVLSNEVCVYGPPVGHLLVQCPSFQGTRAGALQIKIPTMWVLVCSLGRCLLPLTATLMKIQLKYT